jgi:hypothetical protein
MEIRRQSSVSMNKRIGAIGAGKTGVASVAT